MPINFKDIYTTNKQVISNPDLDQVTITTSAIAPNASEEKDLLFAPVVVTSKVGADFPCRIQVYATSEARTADAGRDTETPPPNDLEIVLDTILEAGILELPLQLGRLWVNLDNPQTSNFYTRITNLDTSTQTISVSLWLTVPIGTGGGTAEVSDRLQQVEKLYLSGGY